MIVPLVRSGASSTVSNVRKHFSYQPYKAQAFTSDLAAALEEIESYRALEADWDGYGAVPIDAITLGNALSAAARLIGRAPMPDLTPNSNGTISMEWDSPHGLAHLEVGKSRYAFFIRMASGEKFIKDGVAAEVPQLFGDLITKSMFSYHEPAPTMSRPRLLGVAA
jgi:hypothetical protein